ncbi:MAG: S1/P1 nuclease [Halopseudomonas aestusnigri]|nr:S1/P1 nuclease [Halopseudomonas aestusnigri]
MIKQSTFKFVLLFTAGSVLLPSQVLGWGPEGHKVLGALALDQLNWEAANALIRIMGTDDREELVDWCNWPDSYRATDEGNWSKPQHYINMVPGESEYDRERDCADNMCVTESILRYAAELANPRLGDEMQQQAFGRLCHFVGDLHQPLHAGFGHDRGGNEFDISYKGEDLNLHTFWDHTMIEQNTESWFSLYLELRQRPGRTGYDSWREKDVISWTNESHAIAETQSYPDNPAITDEFADQSWKLARDQLVKGGARLAGLLNTVLAENPETSPDFPDSK